MHAIYTVMLKSTYPSLGGLIFVDFNPSYLFVFFARAPTFFGSYK